MKTMLMLLAFLLFTNVLWAEEQVTEVRYIGLLHIMPREIETVLPFLPGDPFRTELIDLTKKSVSAYFEKRGFFHSKVQVYRIPVESQKVGAVTLVVRIEEGPPCKTVQFEIEEPPGFKSKRVLTRFMKKIKSIANINPGDRYDELYLADQMRTLREWLISENFIVADTDKIRVELNKEKTEAKVFSKIDYGERVTIGFQNNTVFTKGELNGMITQLRTTGLSKDYIGTIERKFIEEYHDRAYSKVSITTNTSERGPYKHVTFVLNEGQRTTLDFIRFEGLSEKNQQIAYEFFEQAVSRLVQRGHYIEKEIEKGIQAVLEKLQSRGFLFAKLISKNIFFPKKDHVQIVVQLFEGEQTLTGDVSLEGFNFFSGDHILSTLNVQQGQPFNPFDIEVGLQRLQSLYFSEGFLEYQRVTPEDQIVEFVDNNRTARIHLHIVEGPQVRIDGIEMRGLQKTRPYVIEREINIKQGDWWNGKKIQEIESNLKRLGIFSDVRVFPQPSASGAGYRKMVIEVKETDPGILEIGPGFRSDLGIKAFAKVSYANLLGRNWIGTLSAEGNRRINDQYRFLEYKLDTSFLNPRFFSSKVSYTAGISTKKQRFPPDFNAVSTQFYTGFERELFHPLSAGLFYRIERTRQFDVFVKGNYSPEDNKTMLIGSLVPSLTLDTRDHPLTTTKGVLSTLSWEYADPLFSNQSRTDENAIGFHRITNVSHFYLPITKRITWSNVVAAGYARSNLVDHPIPLIKLFRLGGYSTIRGFREDSINFDEVSIKGTLSYVNLRTQFDLPFIGDLRFAPFFDAGNVFKDDIYRSYPFMRVGAGAGFHYMTPVGPLNLDVGYNVNAVDTEPPIQVHFSVGMI